jgi:fructose-specific component phosphotransferase system IIB-like protein
MSKGIAPLLIFGLICAAVIIIEGIYVSNMIYDAEVVRRTLRETEILQGLNAIEFAKRAMKAALSRAIEQASYDTLRRGGYFSSPPLSKNCIAYWRNYTQTFIPNFKEELSKSMLNLFNCFGKDYERDYPNIPLLIPDYEVCGNVEIVESEESISVIAFVELGTCAKEDLTLGAKKSGLYDINDNALFSHTAEIYSFKLFKIGEDFTQARRILSVIEEADEAMSNVDGKNCKVIGFEGDVPDPEEKLEEECPNADEDFEDLIRTGMSELEGSYDGMKLEIEITKINVAHEGICNEDTDECTYEYYGDVIVLVKVHADQDDNGKKFFVHDVTGDWRVLSLNFYIVDGNLEETLPELDVCKEMNYC